MDDQPTQEEGLAPEVGDDELAVAPGPAGAGEDGSAHESTVASAPHFEELSQALEGSQPAALSLLYDLDLPVAIELGRTQLSVQDVLSLARGSVVQLDRQAGEPVDVFVGDRRFAEGEVVIVGEQFGVRITRIVNTAAVTAFSGG